MESWKTVQAVSTINYFNAAIAPSIKREALFFRMNVALPIGAAANIF